MRVHLVTALVAAALAALAGCAGLSDGPGPVEQANKHMSTNVFAVGTVITDGGESLTFHGDKNAVLDSVELVGARGIKMLGVRMAGPAVRGAERRGTLFDTMPGFPPTVSRLPKEFKDQYHPRAVIPAIGATLVPRPSRLWSYELLIGLKITGYPVATRQGVRISYHIGMNHYSYYDPAKLYYCTTQEAVARDKCKAPKRFF